MTNLSGKIAFVTGGASGIGMGIAKAFASAGMVVIITYRRRDHLDAAMAAFAKVKATVHPIELDVIDRSAVRSVAQEVEHRFGGVDVVCNNAGVNLLGPMDEATYDDWDWILGVNLGGVINVLFEFLPLLKKSGGGGHIINVASMASFISGPGFGVYATSKFAIRGLSECLRYNLAKFDIGVSLVCTGLTKSNIFEAPLYRPHNLRDTSVEVGTERLQELAAIHELGMDADEVGQRALEGMLRNDFYIFTHPEFGNELRETFDEVLAALPEWDYHSQPERLRYEELRRKAKNDAKALIRNRRASPLRSS